MILTYLFQKTLMSIPKLNSNMLAIELLLGYRNVM